MKYQINQYTKSHILNKCDIVDKDRSGHFLIAALFVMNLLKIQRY